jgi:chemotaxis protein MotA
VFTIIGYVIVLGAVIGGFLLEGGPIGILNQTVEFLIIGGAATGSLLAGTPTKVLGAIGSNLKMAIGGRLQQNRLHGALQHALRSFFCHAKKR